MVSPFHLLDQGLPLPGVRCELRIMLDSDWPTVWQFCQPFYRRISDDFSPKTLDEFCELKRQHKEWGWQARGVWFGSKLGGILELEPVSPLVGQLHVAFAKAFWGTETTLPAMRTGLDLCWGWGYLKLRCVVYPDNYLIKRVINTLGGRLEAVLHCETKRGGDLVDMEQYAIFREG